MCWWLDGGFLKKGRMTSCTQVEDALKMRESSVETSSITISSAKSPTRPVGRICRTTDGSIICP